MRDRDSNADHRPDRGLRGALTPTILLAALLTGCGSDEASDAPVTPPGSSTPGGEAQQGRVLGTLPGFILVNQDGDPFASDMLQGKVWVASFIFTRCGATCPAQTAEFVKLQKQYRNKPWWDEIHFVSLTVDPAHDTPSVLSGYAEQVGADLSHWTFLTGDRESIWKISKDDFKLAVFEETKDDADAVIAHSQNFVLVDRGLKVVGYYDALDPEAVSRMSAKVEELLKDSRIEGDSPEAKKKGTMADGRPIWERRHAGAIPGDVADDEIDDQGVRHIWEPPEVREVAWMKERAEAQLATVGDFEVFYDFRLTDQLPDSGINWRNVIVEDSGKDYFGVHYDHGNGVAVADVDGDGLLDVYFANQAGPNALFRNEGGGKFADITEAAGVAVAGRVSVAGLFADVDNDGDSDLFVTTVRGGNVLFRNDGSGKFEDVSAAAGLDYVGHSSGGAFFDYDRDGHLDLFLSNVGQYTRDQQGEGGFYKGLRDAFAGQLTPSRAELSILYRNRGDGTFEDVSQKVGLFDRSWTGDASPMDLNEDGWPDLYVLSMQGHDEYYENVEGKKFVKKSRELFPRTSWGAMGIKAFDFDNDGLLDIFTTDMHTDMVDYFYMKKRYWYAETLKMADSYPPRFLKTDGNHVMGNAFFRNEGGGKFREVSDEVGAENYWPWGLSVGDLNADGFDDAFLTSSMNYPFRYGVNSVLLNNNGDRFLHSEFILGAEPRRDGSSAPWYELDCDEADAGHKFCVDRTGKVVVWAAKGSRSSVMFDVDGDGDLDIVTNEFNTEPMVLISSLSDQKTVNRLEIQLVGSKSNRDGLGARVSVEVGESSFLKVHDGQSGYLAQSSKPLYFGLGEASQVDQVTVTWPSGKTQTLAGPIAANQTLTIEEEG